MAPCLSWRRPSTFLGPSGPGSPQRSVTGQGPDGVCLCPRSIGVDTHRSGCHAVAAIAHNIILPPPPPAAAGPFFLFILSHQGYTCGYLQPSRRCRVCVPFFLFSSQLDAVVLLPDQLAWLLTFFFSWRETPFDFGRYNLDHYTLFTFSPFSPRPARLVLVSWNHCTTAGHSFLLDIPECPDTPRAPISYTVHTETKTTSLLSSSKPC